jgi:hypothetical protein
MGVVVADTPYPGPAAGRCPKVAVRGPGGALRREWMNRAAQLGGVAALVGTAAVVSLAWAHPATRPLARFCCWYSPRRLSHGAIWTLPGSALLLPHMRMLGPTTIMAGALFLPYVMVAGTRRAVTAFFAGHVVATAAVAAVVLPAAAWAWPPALVLRNAADVGASAGLAAAAGALAGHLGARRGGMLLGCALALWFGCALVVTQRLVEVEHLLALATGVVAERWGRRSCGRVHGYRPDGSPLGISCKQAAIEGHGDGP